MAASEAGMYRIDPRHWQLDAAEIGDVILTHKPQKLTAAQAKKVLEFNHNGAPLAVQVMAEEPEDDTEATE